MRRRSTARMVAEGVEGAVLLGLAAGSWPVSRRWLLDWGAGDEDREQDWPGDRLLSPNVETHTRAIEIEAPTAAVWPWLLQLGLYRAGFYSYELLERLVGIPVTNLESVERSLQHLELGSEVVLHPIQARLYVALLDPGRALCLRSWRDEAELATKAPHLIGTWSLYLRPTTSRTCRLIVRTCYERRVEPSLRERAAFKLEEPVDFVMEQRMLRTIKRLAEREAHRTQVSTTGSSPSNRGNGPSSGYAV